MKNFSLKPLLVATTAATAFLTAGMVSAQESESNKIMMGFNPFGNLGTSTSVSSATAPSYMIGFKASETVLPYAYFSVADEDAYDDTRVGIGGGARMYLGNISNRVRPFVGGALGLVNRSDTGFALGAFFGAEAMVTDAISISGQVGAGLSDDGCDYCDTNFELGTANVMFNLYF